MPEKYKDEYKIQSARLSGFNYSQNGVYFVTICTKSREEFFGSVVDGRMISNDAGKIADKFWREIPVHFPFVHLDAYQIMPNHVHGIIEICKTMRRDEALPRLEMAPRLINTTQDVAVPRLYSGAHPKMSKISPKPGSLSVIIGSYKSIVAKIVRKKLNPTTFAWQARFYDHIIRNEASLNKIREYIQTNPQMWEHDRNNPENLFM